jgi:Tfp pilus assembly protein PilF
MKPLALAVVRFWLVACLALSSAFASEPVGQLIYASGNVWLRHAGEESWQAVKKTADLQAGDSLRTGFNGKAAVMFGDESLVRLHRNTIFRVVESPRVKFDKAAVSSTRNGVKSIYMLDAGEVWLRNNRPHAQIAVRTATGVVGIRGTELGIRLDEDLANTRIVVLEGRVLAENDFGQAEAGPGESLVAPKDKAPFRELLLSPRDGVQWTLRVPETPIHGAAAESLREVRNTLLNGDVSQAAAQLETHLTAAPEDAQAWLLLAQARLAQDRLDQAQAAAERAASLAPDNPYNGLVLGNIAQSRFDLPAAQAHYDRALSLDPNQLEARIKRAEILFGSDHADAAWADMERAYALAPEDARVLSLRGFLQLARRDTTAASASFEQAVAADAGEGEAWLGKAIIAMRQGHEEEAFQSIATAVLVEPRRALYLTYWARMLHQAGRLDRARMVLASAMRADPNDPTPWFIDAIVLQDMNQSGEAIKALQQAIARNDQRAIYRSRLLLDRDLATRNVDLSILFNNFGFGAWAEKKALAAVKRDYLNPNAHVFYAQSLVNREGRSHAHATEATLGLLLQPASINTFNSFNDYTTFFERPGSQGSLSLTAGNHQALGGNLYLYGARPEQYLAYSLSAQASEQTSWAKAFDQENRGVALSVKWEPSTRDNLTFSLRGSLGDTVANTLMTASNQPESQQKFNQTTFDLGYHRHLGAGSDFMAWLNWYDYTGKDNGISSVIPIDDLSYVEELRRSDNPLKRLQLQVQQIEQLDKHQLIFGGVANSIRKNTLTAYDYELLFEGERYPLPEFQDILQADATDRYHALYVKDSWQITPDFSLESSLYHERLERSNLFSGGHLTLTETSPRFGAIWRLSDQDTLRAAAYQYLAPLTFGRLDPGEIAGFPVSRSAYQGRVARETSLAYDHEWQNGFAGLNLFRNRHRLKEAFALDDGSQEVLDYRGRMKGIEGDLNWLLADRNIGLIAHFRRLDVADDSYPTLDRKENLAKLGITWLSPERYRIGLLHTYRQINFADATPSERIHITDLQLGYQLQDKRGQVSLELRNLFDHEFNWVTDPFVLTTRVPDREIALTLLWNF